MTRNLASSSSSSGGRRPLSEVTSKSPKLARSGHALLNPCFSTRRIHASSRRGVHTCGTLVPSVSCLSCLSFMLYSTAWRGCWGCACMSWSVVRYVSQPLVRPVVSLPEGIRYVVLWRMVERLRTLWGVRGTRYTTRICGKSCHLPVRIGSNSRNARATSRDPPTATRRVSAFTPRVRSGQCRVAFSLTLSHAFRVRPLRLGATRALPALEASLAHTGTSGGPAAAGTQLNKTIRGSDLIQPQ